MADPVERQLLRQIGAAWEHAKRQMDDLRESVRLNTELAQTQLKANAIKRDRDVAYRNLGDAIWQLVKKGKLTLPPTLAIPLKAVKAAEDREEAHKRQINDLLKEGAEAAARLPPPPKFPPPSGTRPPAPKSGVAIHPKKR